MSEHIAQLRAMVSDAASPRDSMAPYLAKVRERAYSVTDADVDALKDSGIPEDEIFEQTVAAAVAQGLRRLDIAATVIG